MKMVLMCVWVGVSCCSRQRAYAMLQSYCGWYSNVESMPTNAAAPRDALCCTMLWQVNSLFFGVQHDEMSDFLASILNVVCSAGTSSAAPASRVFTSLFLWESRNNRMLDLRHLLLQRDSDGQTILHLAAIVGKKDPLLLLTLLDCNMPWVIVTWVVWWTTKHVRTTTTDY